MVSILRSIWLEAPDNVRMVMYIGLSLAITIAFYMFEYNGFISEMTRDVLTAMWWMAWFLDYPRIGGGMMSLWMKIC